MNTTIAITVIVAALILATSIVTAIRDTAQAKYGAKRCPNCGQAKEEEA